MGAKNCAETPRQKMIGMMYLFLTAMLALNVSSEVLNGFIKVDDSLRSSVESFNKRNGAIYKSLETRHAIEPLKVQHWLDASKSVKAKADSLFEEIRNYKWDMVIDADALPKDHPRIGEVEHIGAKDNLDAPTRIMIPATLRESRQPGFILKNHIIAFRDSLIREIEIAVNEFGAKPDSSIITSLYSYLSPVDVKAEEGGHDKSWEETYFAHMPVSASVVLLSKLQNDIRDVESLMINYFYGQIDATDFKVNKLKALIIPESNYVIKGGTFKAQIILAGEDTTKQLEINVNNSVLSPSSNGVYQRVCNEVGTYPLIGNLIFVDQDGIRLSYPFKTEYKVEEPSATVSATKMNVLYVGVENPLSISVPGVANQDLRPKISNGTLKLGQDGEYTAIPKDISKDAVIIVNAIINGTERLIAKHPFRVKLLPDPLPFLYLEEIKADAAGNIMEVPRMTNESKLPFTAIKSMKGLKAELPESDFEVEYNITGYNILLINDNGNSYPASVAGDKFNGEIKQFLNNNFKGTITITDIKAIGPDGVPRDLPPLVTKIK